MDTVPLPAASSHRLSNIDMLRGLVIIIMALDHVRDFFLVGGVEYPMADPDVSVGLYITRWITHFCAPVFIFLAGTSVGLMAERKSAKDIGAFVFKRGLWLVFVEVAIISTAWTFAPFGEAAMGGSSLIILQVIWAIGVSMMILACVQFLGPRFCLYLGAAIVAGHNMLDPIWPVASSLEGNDIFWAFLHSQGTVVIGPFFVEVVYPLLPCAGIMLLGYGTSFIFSKPAVARDALLITIGVTLISIFVLLRYFGIYGDPNPWEIHSSGPLSTFFDFMNVSKYPLSLLYFLATIGPMAIICAHANKINGWLKETLVMFGRVPFAFYVAHFYLIHLLSVLFGMVQGFEANQLMHIFIFYPEGYGTGLVGVYLIWGVVVAMLYPFCKWMAKVKATRKNWWLSYL
ncbi:MAG: DUF1624 domain-containing protein [Kordiimonadaceae bacterium]|nr:DUF1624 domain-containing protein [Kordiimonadaceae bacterium]MBT6031342.1 DUF1624 domain-containing protein [Kordiimonadaceae bacterium]